jgi:uncharacterized protein (DUF302 family)
MTTDTMKICFESETDLSFDDAVARCREELAKEDFGILSEIDVQAKMKEKLDVDREPYLILGACHPPSANRVLDAKPELGVMLPCNVTVSVENGQTIVRAMDPGPVMGMMGDPTVNEVGAEVGKTLEKVVKAVTG